MVTRYTPPARQLSRRQFLARSGMLAGLAWTALSVAKSAGNPNGQPLPKIGIQLYTVRKQMQESVPKTLATLAQIGYDEVEFAGYFGEKPKDIRRYLGDNGLKSYSAHVFLEEVRENLGKTFDEVAAAGHQYLVLGMGDSDLTTLDQYKSYLDFLRKMSTEARSRGLQFAYHNHDFEFQPVEGIRPYDLLLQEITSEQMKLTMDMYWITRAGADPFAYFDRYPGRFKQCHLKDMGPHREMADVGAGTIDFVKILGQRKQAGLEHFYVERDDAKDPFQSARNSLSYLRTLKV